MLASATTALLRRQFPNGRIRFAVLGSFWTAVAVVSAVHWELFYILFNPYQWWQLLIAKLGIWYVWGLLTPLILHLAHRFPVRRPHRLRSLAFLSAAGLGIVGIYLLFYTVWVFFIVQFILPNQTIDGMLSYVISMHSTWYVLAFISTIAIEHVVAFQKRLSDREQELAQMELQLVKGRLALLTDRLHPHFLFNALNTVGSLVLDRKPTDAYDVVVHLSHLLRSSLDLAARPTISLAEELEMIDAYVAIVTARFGDRVNFVHQIEPGVHDLLVPSLILQPLYENAVKHGIGELPEGGTITLSAHRTDDDLHITITNPARPSSETTTHGTGLTLVRERLAVLYGNGRTLTTRRPSPREFVVELRIPIRGRPSTDTDQEERERDRTQAIDRR